MKGLLLKDFYNIARSGRLYLAMLLIYGVLSYANGGALMLTMVAVLFAMMLPMSAIGYDEKDRWEPLCLTLPVAPAVMVLEKYVLAILCWIGSLFAPTRGLANLLHWACLLAAAFCCVRAFSQNLGRRQQENQKFLAMTRGFRIGRNWRAKMEQKRQYKVFKCPSCGVKLRVPRGKGKIKVTCRQCGASFEERS